MKRRHLRCGARLRVLLAIMATIVSAHVRDALAWCTPSPVWKTDVSIIETNVLTRCKPCAALEVTVWDTNQACGVGVTYTKVIMQAMKGSVSWDWTEALGWVKTGSNPDCDIVIYQYPDRGGMMGVGLCRSEDAPDQGVTISLSGTKKWFVYCNPPGEETHYSVDFSMSYGFRISNEEGSGCAACGDPSLPQRLPLASARVWNDRGPDVSFGLGVSSVKEDAGVLALKARVTTASLSSPAALYLPFFDSGQSSVIDVVSNNNMIQQVKCPQGLLNISNVNSTKYEIQAFYDADVTPKGGNSLYGTTAAPFKVWTVDGSGGTNVLVLTETPSGSASRSFTFVYTNSIGQNQWRMSDNGSLRTVASWQVQNATNSAMYSVVREVLSGSTVVEREESIYSSTNGIVRLIQKIDGAGATTNITSYWYTSDNQIQEIDYPDGNWVYHVYGGDGRLWQKYSPYGNTPSPAATGMAPDPYSSREVDYAYDLIATGDGGYRPLLPRKETTYLPSGGVQYAVSVLYRSCPQPDEVWEWHCPQPTASWNDPENQLTITVFHTDSTNAAPLGSLNYQVLPDRTARLYSYFTNANGLVTNITVSTGEPNSAISPGWITNGTQTTTLLNSVGKPIEITTQVISNGVPSAIISRVRYTYTDALQLSHYTTDLAGRTNQYYYACCGLSSMVDPDGVTTVYDYDNLRRRVASTVLRGGSSGVQTTNILDAAGRVLVEKRIGTNGSPITLRQFQYDVLGRVTRETNALNGVTTYAYATVSNQACVTNTFPDGGTRVEVFYADGRLQSVSGTAVAPVRYDYGLEEDGSSLREYKLEVKLNGVLTNEWNKTLTDGAGNTYKTVYAAAGSTPAVISYFNNSGQLTNQVDPDGISTIYAYNAKGERVLTVLDMDRDNVIDFDGTDRITFVTNDVVNSHSTIVRRTRVYAWDSNGSSASNLISTVETSTNELSSWHTTWNGGVGITSASVTAYAGTGNRYVTNIAPDNSYTVSTYQYGRLASVFRYDAQDNQIGGTSYGYDAHDRQTLVTDARTGTTTSYFNAADQISGIVTPAPASGQSSQVTTNYFDNMGRIAATRLPDNTSVSNVYYPNGKIKLNYGSRTYPVGYSYDDQGRLKTMTNWSGFTAAAGPRVTTWNYDIYRGYLTNKTFDGNTAGPRYTFTAGGRLLARLWARGVNTTNSYNNAGDLAAVAYSDATPAVGYGYDRRGRQNTVTNGSMVSTLSLSDAGQVLNEAWSGGVLNGLSVTNGYDHLLRRTNLVARNSSTPILQQSMAFDATSRLRQITDYTTGSPYSATYAYLANSPLVSQVFFTNNGVGRMTTTKQYDLLNRLTAIASASSSITSSFAYAYNTANQRTGVTNADGSFWLHQYDSLGQVTSGKKFWADSTPIAGQQFGYTFDDIGNRQATSAGADQWGANQRLAGYTANNLNQYTSRTVPRAVDILGLATNTATVTVNDIRSYRKGSYYRVELPVDNSAAPVYQFVTNLAVLNNGTNPDILTNVTGNIFVPQTPESFAYDADGNLTNDGHWSYTWDAENRLAAMAVNTAVGPQISLKFEYDHRSRRIRKQVWSNKTWSGNPTNDLRFVYDGWNLIATLDSQFSTLNSFMWGLDLSGTPQGAGGIGGLIAVSDAALGVHFAAFDGNGNVACLIKATDGTSSANNEYAPFGEVIRNTGPMTKVNPFRFSTKYQDDETDLLYYGYRYYNASTGRWQSHDPLADEAFARGLPLWAKAQSRRNATSVQHPRLAFSERQSGETHLLISGPKGFSSLLEKISSTLRIARETSNPYQFVQNAATVLLDPLGLKPCSSCSDADIQREGIARGLEYIHRTIEEQREYGGKICCNECLSRVYSANVVYGPVGEGTVNIANSQCRLGDKVVADWHTHPDGSTQTGEPNQRSDDRRNVIGSAYVYDCDYVGFMTNNHLDTTRMDGQGVETTVGTSSGNMSRLLEETPNAL